MDINLYYKKYNRFCSYFQNDFSNFKIVAFDKAFDRTIDCMLKKETFNGKVHEENYFNCVLLDKYLKYSSYQKEKAITYFDNGNMNQKYVLSYFEYGEISPLLENHPHSNTLLSLSTSEHLYFLCLTNKEHEFINFPSELEKKINTKAYNSSLNIFGIDQIYPTLVYSILSRGEYLSKRESKWINFDKAEIWRNPPKISDKKNLKKAIHQNFFDFVKKAILFYSNSTLDYASEEDVKDRLVKAFFRGKPEDLAFIADVFFHLKDASNMLKEFPRKLNSYRPEITAMQENHKDELLKTIELAPLIENLTLMDMENLPLSESENIILSLIITGTDNDVEKMVDFLLSNENQEILKKSKSKRLIWLSDIIVQLQNWNIKETVLKVIRWMRDTEQFDELLQNSQSQLK